MGGSVRVRPGTVGRVGHAYRVTRGRYGYGYGYGHHHHGYGFWGGVGVGIGLGFYYSWLPHWGYYPRYYQAYGPGYGMQFGYGTTYYGPAYSESFEDDGQGEVVYEEVIEDPQPEEAVVGEPEEGAAPYNEEPLQEAPLEEAPAEQGAQAPESPAAGEDQQVYKPHADFEPSIKAFLAGDYQGALGHLDNVVQAEPENGEAWLAVMHANFALGQYGPAALGLAKAADLDAFPRGYRFDPRPLYPQAGSFEKALQALDDRVKSKPDDADALLVRAYLYVALGERSQAQDALQHVLELRGNDETAPLLSIALLPPPAAAEAGEAGAGGQSAQGPDEVAAFPAYEPPIQGPQVTTCGPVS